MSRCHGYGCTRETDAPLSRCRDGQRRILCAGCKLADRGPPDARGRAVGKRASNGRPRHNMDHWLDAKFGKRVVTGIAMDAHHQRLVLTCKCGAVSKQLQSNLRKGIGVCKRCRDTGTPRPRREDKRKRTNKAHDYASYIGKRYGEHVIESIPDKVTRASFVLRCPEGHRFVRFAWDVVGEVYKDPKCPTCTNMRRKRLEITKPGAITRGEPDEVCGCSYWDGRLRVECRRCGERRQGAA